MGQGRCIERRRRYLRIYPMLSIALLVGQPKTSFCAKLFCRNCVKWPRASLRLSRGGCIPCLLCTLTHCDSKYRINDQTWSKWTAETNSKKTYRTPRENTLTWERLIGEIDKNETKMIKLYSDALKLNGEKSGTTNEAIDTTSVGQMMKRH